MDDDTSAPALDALLAELDDVDHEHPDVAVTHESEWGLSVFGTGLVVWENVEEGEPRHLAQVSRQEARRLLGLLAQGDLDAVEQQDWQPGYGG